MVRVNDAKTNVKNILRLQQKQQPQQQLIHESTKHFSLEIRVVSLFITRSIEWCWCEITE